MINEIQNYGDFITELLAAGFSEGGSASGVVSVVPFGWGEPSPYPTRVRWHTGDADTDPWEWRLRVLAERDDIAYAKLFFKRSGFITREWYPRFLAARRGGRTFEDEYARGTVSHLCKTVYNAVREYDGGAIPAHTLRQTVGAGSKSAFDAAVTELQGRMFITIAGGAQRVNRAGEQYGWTSTAFATVERFWGDEITSAADEYDADEAAAEIERRVLELNPDANPKLLAKFINKCAR
ncbi:MAG: hypothetical protein LBN30_10680 [Oscillospiraceae bacterium]|jgi:hypothetical protein|nr:hypothetical protein [Oscillospiraceae bacterium]